MPNVTIVVSLLSEWNNGKALQCNEMVNISNYFLSYLHGKYHACRAGGKVHLGRYSASLCAKRCKDTINPKRQTNYNA